MSVTDSPEIPLPSEGFTIFEGSPRLFAYHTLPSGHILFETHTGEEWVNVLGSNTRATLRLRLAHQKATDVYVLCNNDFPHSVFENEEDAEKERDRLNEQDEKRRDGEAYPSRRIFYHINTVPLIKEKQ